MVIAATTVEEAVVDGDAGADGNHSLWRRLEWRFAVDDSGVDGDSG
jgi:hypothetical protein